MCDQGTLRIDFSKQHVGVVVGFKFGDEGIKNLSRLRQSHSRSIWSLTLTLQYFALFTFFKDSNPSQEAICLCKRQIPQHFSIRRGLFLRKNELGHFVCCSIMDIVIFS
jgi:hypothetical protein